MGYSSLFVCMMGMGTVFFGLICLIIITYSMSYLCEAKHRSSTETAPTPVPAAEPIGPELVAAISAALAEDLGTDITGIRILSIKKL